MGNGGLRRLAGDRFARRRGTALVAVVVAAVAVFFIITRDGDESESLALEFARAWAAQEFNAMHGMLTPTAQKEHPVADLTNAYTDAQELATVTGIGVGDAADVADGAAVQVEMVIRTALFGDLRGPWVLPVTVEGVAWEPHLVFPGLKPGEMLNRETGVPERGSILAADGSVIAGGPAAARTGEVEGASQIAGSVAAPTGELAEAARRRGFPSDAPLGTGGLELALDDILAGRPGGTLIASGSETPRVLAESAPKAGRDVKTTIEPAVQAAATAALGSRFGGVTVTDRRGAILGLAGVAFSAPQPPGSTFKMVTAIAALESGGSSPGEEFPVTTGEVVGGREIENAHDEPCGGTLVDSFAHSCNSVFAPLGVRIGGELLVETAERLGFNSEPDLLSGDRVAAGTAEPSTIPTSFASELELGVSAIGQGKVLATPLGMASVAQAIADGGRRTPPFVYNRANPPKGVRAMSTKTSRQLTAMMEAVVAEGTGTSAQLPGVRVAGKTGTAELGPKADQELPPPDPEDPDAEPPEPEMEVDAWFVAFAPAQKPRYVVSVMLVNADGDGGEVAAPIARQILDALL